MEKVEEKVEVSKEESLKLANTLVSEAANNARWATEYEVDNSECWAKYAKQAHANLTRALELAGVK